MASFACKEEKKIGNKLINEITREKEDSEVEILNTIVLPNLSDWRLNRSALKERDLLTDTLEHTKDRMLLQR